MAPWQNFTADQCKPGGNHRVLSSLRLSVVAERSAGNPFLVTELARLLADRAGEPDAVRGAVPDPVRVIAAARLAELPERTRRVLSAAAVLGTRFRLDVLAELMAMSLGEVSGALADGHAAGLLAPGEPGEDRFRHDLVRDAIYAAMPASAREEMHARAGDVLAAHAGRGRGVDAAEVAHHLLRAGPEATARGADYASRAGDRALAALAFEDAVHWYERADGALAAGAGRPRGRCGAPGRGDREDPGDRRVRADGQDRAGGGAANGGAAGRAGTRHGGPRRGSGSSCGRA